MSHMTSPRTRRSFLQGGLLASLALVVACATLPITEVAAEKKTTKASVSARTESQREVCETTTFSNPPGKLAVLEGPNGGNTTECKGGQNDGYTCINTQTTTSCTKPRTLPDSPLLDPGDAPVFPLESAVPMEPADSVTDPGDGGSHPQDAPTSTGKHGKHSKHNKRGKGRKK